MAIQHQAASVPDAQLAKAIKKAEAEQDRSPTGKLWLDCLLRERRVREAEGRLSRH